MLVIIELVIVILTAVVVVFVVVVLVVFVVVVIVIVSVMMIGYKLIVMMILFITTYGNALLSSFTLPDIKTITSSLSSSLLSSSSSLSSLKRKYQMTSLKLHSSYILSDELKKTIENGPIDSKDR